MTDPTQTKADDQDRALEHGSSGATADAAVEGSPTPESRSVDGPYARPATPETSTEDGLAQRRDQDGGAGGKTH